MTGRAEKAFCAAVFCVSVWLPGPAIAASAGGLVKEGNQAFRAGRYDEALNAYEKASVEVPESPHVYFDKGAAHYRKGEYREAGDSFGKAALKSRDITLEAKSAYNQGNCLFREGERQRDSDLQKSLEALKNAISHYQQALKLDPGMTDAAHNIEVSRLIMKQILDEIKKQQQDQQQQAGQDEQKSDTDKPQQNEKAGTEQGEEEKAQQDDKSGIGQAGQQTDKQAVRPPDETASAIIQQEKEDREQRALAVPGGYMPVDKDW